MHDVVLLDVVPKEDKARCTCDSQERLGGVHCNRVDRGLQPVEDSGTLLFRGLNFLENCALEHHNLRAGGRNQKVGALECFLDFVLEVGGGHPWARVRETDALGFVQVQVFEPGDHLEIEVVEPYGAVSVAADQVLVVHRQDIDTAHVLVESDDLDQALFVLLANALDNERSVENQDVPPVGARNRHLSAWDEHGLREAALRLVFGREVFFLNAR